MYYVDPNARLMHLWISAKKVNADVLPFLAKNKSKIQVFNKINTIATYMEGKIRINKLSFGHVVRIVKLWIMTDN